jgi:hypothetical protein
VERIFYLAKSFVDLGRELGELVEKKNAAYGNATIITAQVMRLLFPNGVKPEQYELFHYCEMVLHKLCRIASQPDAFGEDPVQDIAGYSVLELGRVKDKEQTKTDLNKSDGTNFCSKCKLSKKSKLDYLCLPCDLKQGPFQTIKTAQDVDARHDADKREKKLAKEIIAARNKPSFGADSIFPGLYQQLTKDDSAGIAWQPGDSIPERLATQDVRNKYRGYWSGSKGSDKRHWVVTSVQP